MKHTAVALILSVSAAFCPLVAQTVEVNLLVSADSDGESALRSSELVIEGVLDSLFETGFIGTNARPSGGSEESFKAWKPGTLTSDGFVDYVILVLASYGKGLKVPSCVYALVRVSDGATVFKGEVPAEVPRTSLQADIDSACVSVGRKLGMDCGGALALVSTRWRNHEYFKA